MANSNKIMKVHMKPKIEMRKNHYLAFDAIEITVSLHSIRRILSDVFYQTFTNLTKKIGYWRKSAYIC